MSVQSCVIPQSAPVYHESRHRSSTVLYVHAVGIQCILQLQLTNKFLSHKLQLRALTRTNTLVSSLLLAFVLTLPCNCRVSYSLN